SDTSYSSTHPGLCTSSLSQQSLSLAERIDRISGQPPGILYRRLRGAVRSTVSERHVARAVDRQAGHESIDDICAVRVPGRGLWKIGAHCTTGNVYLIPARRREAGRVPSPDRVGRPQRLDAAHIGVLVLHHGPNRKNVQSVAAL